MRKNLVSNDIHEKSFVIFI